MVQVIATVPCVTRVGEAPVSLAKGEVYDLPARVADRLVSASLCDRVGGSDPEAQDTTEAPGAPEDTTEAENPAPAKKAAAKPRSRKAPTKKVAAAPENK